MSPTSKKSTQDPKESFSSNTVLPREPLKHLVISCSLSTTSRSALMADYLTKSLEVSGDSVESVDLRSFELPFCDGSSAYSHPNVIQLSQKIADAHSITLAVPIYNYDVGGPARNIISLTGQVWTEKVVGLIGAAGGDRSFMSLVSLGNSLMLDFRSVVVPRYVYASKAEFASGRPQGEIANRLDLLAADLGRFATAFRLETQFAKAG